MANSTELRPQGGQSLGQPSSPVKLLLALGGLVVTLIVLWYGFLFLRDNLNSLPKILTTIIAIFWGVGGVAALFLSANGVVEGLGGKATAVLRPFLFVGPAMFMLGWFLLLPTIRTIYLSFFNADSSQFVGFDNYIYALTDRAMLETFRNNLWWMIFGTGGCVILGLIIAVLADKSDFETLAKSLIFMPMAISFVGAGVIWRFVYYYAPPGQTQIGLLNAFFTSLGFEPQAWTTLIQPQNNFFLIAIMIWLQTGFAMVIFSSAIKAISSEVLEAARVDGANEWQVFFKITMPALQGTILTVTTTIIIFSLKIFDIVIVMTGGQYGTHVIATQFYRQLFTYRDNGRGSAIAMLLLIAVVPMIIYNLRQMNRQEGFR